MRSIQPKVEVDVFEDKNGFAVSVDSDYGGVFSAVLGVSVRKVAAIREARRRVKQIDAELKRLEKRNA